MLLGCIADDLTGATDLALTLARGGMRVVQTTGLPPDGLDLGAVDAVVVALKSRTVPAMEAVEQSLAALAWLQGAGAARFFFKYCSTFDSTPQGNIGPVAEALLERLGAPITIACPAFPATGRTLYMGHLFVNGVPLSESSMKDHPLTPMRDSDLRRVLRPQTRLEVGGIGHADVAGGADTIRDALRREQGAGKRIVVVDAIADADLMAIGAAVAELKLVTGGSGVALGLPAAWHRAGLLQAIQAPADGFAAPAGREAILAGSCSVATRGQVAAAKAAGLPAMELDAIAIAEGRVTAADVLAWLDEAGPRPLVYSSATPERVEQAQARLGREQAGAAVEALLGQVAAGLPGRGFTRLVVAGGETSGAVVQALGVRALAIGPEINPGVPWTRSLGGVDIVLALKSGNFGAPDFFLRAWDKLR